LICCAGELEEGMGGHGANLNSNCKI
jgi:hypothetical protein